MQHIRAEVDAEIEKRAGVMRPLGYLSGLPTLDRALNGLRKQRYHVIAAFSSIGKTWAVTHIGNAVLADGASVDHYSLEQARAQMMVRYWANRARVDSNYVERDWYQTLEERERVAEAKEWLDTRPLRIYTQQRTVQAIRRRSRINRADVVIVDYIQIMRASEKHGSRYDMLTQISSDLYEFSQEPDGPVVIVLSQTANDRAETMGQGESKAKGSGDIKAHADSFTELNRDKLEAPNQLSWKLDKNRHGRTVTIPCTIDLRFGHIQEEARL